VIKKSATPKATTKPQQSHESKASTAIKKVITQQSARAAPGKEGKVAKPSASAENKMDTMSRNSTGSRPHGSVKDSTGSQPPVSASAKENLTNISEASQPPIKKQRTKDTATIGSAGSCPSVSSAQENLAKTKTSAAPLHASASAKGKLKLTTDPAASQDKGTTKMQSSRLKKKKPKYTVGGLMEYAMGSAKSE
jgi:hypothetical protein